MNTCCDSWGRCIRAPGCPAGSTTAAASVAPVKAHYRRSTDLDDYMSSRPAPLDVPVCDDMQAIEHDLRALINRANAPGQRGSVWFAGTEPEPGPSSPPAPSQPGTGASHYAADDEPPKREPFTGVELFALVILLILSAASSVAVLGGIWWLVSLAQGAA